MSLIFIDPLADATSAWSIVGGAPTRAQAIRRPDDDAASYISSTGGGAVNQDFSVTKPGAIIRVNSNPVLVMRGIIFSNAVPGVNEALNASVLLGGVAVSGPSINTLLAASPAWETQQFSVTRPGGGAWTADDLVSPTLGLRCQGPFTNATSVVAITTLYLVVDVTLTDKGYAFYASRRLRLRRLPGGVIEAIVPSLEYLDNELLDLMALSHPELPSFDGRGAGVKPWERWPVLKLISDPDLERGCERMLLRDLRSCAVRYWDVAKSLRVGSDFAEGIARLDPGSARAWTRPSQAWVYRADKKVVLIGVNSEKHDIDGDLFEGARTNLLIQSAFKNGTTGAFTSWSFTGGGTAVADTTDNLFGALADGSAQSVKLTGAGSAATPCSLGSFGVPAVGSFAANALCSAAFWHKDDSGQTTWFAIQRTIDSLWWRESDQTWQVAKTWNPMPVSTSTARYTTKTINVGTGVTNLIISLGIPSVASGGILGQVCHLYHAQVELAPYPSSTIPTEATSVARSADMLTESNNTAARVWREGWGTFRCKVRPWWDSALHLVGGDKRTIIYAQHDANNYDWLYYDATAGALKFERKAAGVVYAASKAIALSQFSLYNVAARWTGTAGELNLAPYTLSVFVWPDGGSFTGAKGTDAVAAALVPAGTCNLERGSQAGLLNWDGNIWAFEVNQQVLSDNAVGRY